MPRFARSVALATMLFAGAALAQPAPSPPSGTDHAPAPVVPETPPAPAAPVVHAAAVPAFPVEEVRLGNGLQVLLAPDDSLPNVAVLVKYHVGSADEPDGLNGIAHLVEHLTYERTSHIARGSLLRILANAGATDLNGETTLDATYYHEAVPPERLELALWLESDRMGFFLGAVDEAALEQERRVVLTELRTRVADTPGGLLPLAALEASFPAWHPYHEDIDLENGDTKKITLADIRAFYGTWYGPENATLILAGRFQKEKARTLVERYFGTLPGRPPPRRPALPVVQRKGPTRVEIGAAVQEEAVQLSWVTPAFGMPGDAALDWLASLLVAGPGTRLQRELVDQGIAVSVRASQSSKRLASLFGIRVTAVEGHTAEEIIDVVDRNLRMLATLGPSPAEVQRAAGLWDTVDLFLLEGAMGRARLLSSATTLSRGMLPIPFDWREHRGAAFSAADLRDAAAKYLSKSARAAEVIVRPKKGTPLQGVVVSREEP